MTVGGCIEDKRYILSVIAGIYGARTVLLHTCHSWRGNVLKSCVGEWGCVMVLNFRASLQFPPFIEEFVSSLNRGDI